jgi:hypothetical protein
MNNDFMKNLGIALAAILLLSACREASERDDLRDLQSEYTRTNGVYQGPVTEEVERDVRGLTPARPPAGVGGPGEPGALGRYEHFEGSTRSPVDRETYEIVRKALVEHLGAERAERITIDVISQRVTLRGKVQSEEERKEIVALVDSLMTVGAVNDQLRAVGEDQAEPPQRPAPTERQPY